MDNYKTIEKLGLEVHKFLGVDVVSAENLEMVLSSAGVVHGYGGQWSGESSSHDTHTGLIIGVTPILKKTKAEAALELLKEMFDDESLDLQGSEHHYKTEIKRLLEM